MRPFPILFLILLLVPFARAGVPPSGQPTAWMPAEGTAWALMETPADEVPGFSLGMRPVRPLATTIRQGDWGAQADFALELAQGGDLLPNLMLDSRGHGASMTERLDSLLLGWKPGWAHLSAGLGRAGDGGVRPVLHLHLPLRLPTIAQARDSWIAAGLGGLHGPMLAVGWSPEPGQDMSLAWHRDRGLVAGLSVQFAGAASSAPYFGRQRRADSQAWSDIGPFQSPGAVMQAGLARGRHPTSDRVEVASHRLGLPGVSARIYGPDVEKWRRHRISAAEIRRGTRFDRAETPDRLGHHWELTADATLETEPGPRGYEWASRASLGGQLHLLPWPGLVLTGEGRLARAANIPPPRWYPPSPARDDAAHYLQRTISLDRAQVAYVRALTPSLDLAVEGGHLEAMYGGGGVELRHQPLRARWSLGIVAHHVWKRPPTVQTIYRGSGRSTGFVNAGWEGSDGGTRAELSAGRYLAGDWGGGFTLSRQFGAGMVMAMDATASTRTSRLGLSVTLPLVGLDRQVDVVARVKVRPLARECAERLDRTLTLSDLRHAAGYARVTRDWDQGFR